MGRAQAVLCKIPSQRSFFRGQHLAHLAAKRSQRRREPALRPVPRKGETGRRSERHAVGPGLGQFLEQAVGRECVRPALLCDPEEVAIPQVEACQQALAPCAVGPGLGVDPSCGGEDAGRYVDGKDRRGIHIPAGRQLLAGSHRRRGVGAAVGAGQRRLRVDVAAVNQALDGAAIVILADAGIGGTVVLPAKRATPFSLEAVERADLTLASLGCRA